MSPDGRYVAGRSFNASNQPEAFFWSFESGVIGLGDLPGGAVSSEANAVSNSTLAIGTSIVGVGGKEEAFVGRWPTDL